MRVYFSNTDMIFFLSPFTYVSVNWPKLMDDGWLVDCVGGWFARLVKRTRAVEIIIQIHSSSFCAAKRPQ